MGFRRFHTVEPPVPPAGYGLRAYRSGDEVAWLAILNQGNFGVWDLGRLESMLSGSRAPMPRDGIFFATLEDRPVGTASTFLYHDGAAEFSEVGWVAVHPDHRGHGLGRTVTQAVLWCAKGLGHTYTFLKTEVYRPAAIKTYLRLGFEPEMTHPEHPGIWQKLLGELGAL